MAAQFGPLNAHDQQRVYDTIQGLGQQGISDQQILEYLAQSGALGRSALEQYMSAAGMNIAQGFQPQFDQARNTLGANPLLAQSGYANRLNRQLLTDLASRQSSAFDTAAADQARNQVGYLQGLRGQQVGLRSQLAGQGFDTILKPPQQPSALQQVGQIGGALIGGLAGGPSGAAQGYSVGGSLGTGLGGGGQTGYSQSGISGGYSGYVPGQNFYPNSLYRPMPAGGYSDPVSSQYGTMMRTGGGGQYLWQR